MHNAAHEAWEGIHTTSINTGLAIVQRLGHLLGVDALRNTKILRSTKDMKRAFRQLSWADEHSKYHIICVWHPIWNVLRRLLRIRL